MDQRRPEQVPDETTQQKRICRTALPTSNDRHYTSQRQVRTADRKPEQQSIVSAGLRSRNTDSQHNEDITPPGAESPIPPQAPGEE